MRRPRPRRFVLIQLMYVAVALVLGLVLLRRGGSGGVDEASAEPRKPARTTAAGAPLLALAATPSVASAVAALPEGGAPPASESSEPIDLAIAPDGGVPFHAGGAAFRSPFAKPNAGPPARVKVGMLLNSLDEYDVKTGTFTADFFLSLTSTQAFPALNLQFPNGTLETKEVLAEKPTFKLYRMAGKFKSPADLRKYPFDSQELRILIEDDVRGIDQIRFTADKERTQLARGFRAVGWQVDFVEARALSQSYPDRFEGDDLYYGRYVFSIGLERFATSAVFTVFVPAFVIVTISLLGMWVPAKNMEVRSNAGAPMLAAAVLFHFALMQELPATSYLTRADKVMMGVYICLALGMISTWWMFLVREERIPLVFRTARVLVPLVSAVVMALACLA